MRAVYHFRIEEPLRGSDYIADLIVKGSSSFGRVGRFLIKRLRFSRSGKRKIFNRISSCEDLSILVKENAIS
jgi:hypothetical protein